MALIARHTRVSACQRKGCCAVIEYSARKGSRIVTSRTLLRETGQRMIRICGAAEIRLMAGDTGTRKSGIDVILVARRALNSYMGSGQRELR